MQSLPGWQYMLGSSACLLFFLLKTIFFLCVGSIARIHITKLIAGNNVHYILFEYFPPLIHKNRIYFIIQCTHTNNKERTSLFCENSLNRKLKTFL